MCMWMCMSACLCVCISVCLYACMSVCHMSVCHIVVSPIPPTNHEVLQPAYHAAMNLRAGATSRTHLGDTKVKTEKKHTYITKKPN